MVILQIISLVLVGMLLVICSILLMKKGKTTNALTMKEYMGLRAYIQMCFDEQNKLNTKINELIIHSMESNNNTVVNAVSKNSGLQMQQLNDIMSRLNQMLETVSQSMQNATGVLQTGLD